MASPGKRTTLRHSMDTLRLKSVKLQSGRRFKIEVRRVEPLALEARDAVSGELLAGVAYTLSRKDKTREGKLDDEGRLELTGLAAGVWKLELALVPDAAPPVAEDEPKIEAPEPGVTVLRAGVAPGEAPTWRAEAEPKAGVPCLVEVLPWVVHALLVDDARKPLPDGPATVVLPSGQTLQGALRQGCLRVGPAEEGSCTIELAGDERADVAVASVHWAAKAVTARVPLRAVAPSPLPADLLDVPVVDWQKI